MKKTESRGRLEAATLVCIQAVVDLFPNIRPIRTGIDGQFFYIDFYSDKGFPKESLAFLKERVDLLIGQDRPIPRTEMLKSNVLEYLKSKGWRESAQWLGSVVSEGVIPLIRLDSVILPFPANVPKNVAEAAVVELLTVEPFNFVLDRHEWPAFRLWGAAFGDKQGAKQYRKIYKEGSKRNSLEYIQKKEWVVKFSESGEPQIVWLPKGLEIQKELVNYWVEGVEKLGYVRIESPAVHPYGVDEFLASNVPPQALWHLRLLGNRGQWRGSEVGCSYDEVNSSDLLDPFSTCWPRHDLNFAYLSYPSIERELISSLQFMLRTFKMLKVKCEWTVLKAQSSNLFSKKEWSGYVRQLQQALEQLSPEVVVNVSFETNSTLLPKIVGKFIDPMGRRWPGPEICLLPPAFLNKMEKGMRRDDVYGLYWSMFRSLERWLPLLDEALFQNDEKISEIDLIKKYLI